MSDEPPYILDVQGLEGEEPQPVDSSRSGRNWIGVNFECCGVYVRIYRNREGSAYAGHCPRCHRPARVRVGPGGTSSRLFRAT